MDFIVSLFIIRAVSITLFIIKVRHFYGILCFLWIDCLKLKQPIGTWRNVGVHQRLTSLTSVNTELFGQQVSGIGINFRREWSFARGSRVVIRPEVATFIHHKKAFGIHASCNLVSTFYPYSYSKMGLLFIYVYVCVCVSVRLCLKLKELKS